MRYFAAGLLIASLYAPLSGCKAFDEFRREVSDAFREAGKDVGGGLEKGLEKGLKGVLAEVFNRYADIAVENYKNSEGRRRLQLGEIPRNSNI